MAKLFYENVFKRLNKERVRYVVAGGVAVNLHGIPRVTADLDLLIDLSQEDVNRFAKAMKELNFIPKIPIKIEDFGDAEKRQGWIKDKDMRVFSLWNKDRHYGDIDVFVENPIDFEELYKKRLDIKIGNFKIPLINIEHLIVLKKIAGRKQDLSDIESLKKVKKLIKELSK